MSDDSASSIAPSDEVESASEEAPWSPFLELSSEDELLPSPEEAASSAESEHGWSPAPASSDSGESELEAASASSEAGSAASPRSEAGSAASPRDVEVLVEDGDDEVAVASGQASGSEDDGASQSDSSESSSGSESDSSAQSGKPGPGLKAEVFCDATTFPGLEEHFKQHSPSLADVKDCDKCLFWTNRFNWSRKFAYNDPVTGGVIPWIAVSNTGQATFSAVESRVKVDAATGGIYLGRHLRAGLRSGVSL